MWPESMFQMQSLPSNVPVAREFGAMKLIERMSWMLTAEKHEIGLSLQHRPEHGQNEEKRTAKEMEMPVKKNATRRKQFLRYSRGRAGPNPNNSIPSCSGNESSILVSTPEGTNGRDLGLARCHERGSREQIMELSPIAEIVNKHFGVFCPDDETATSVVQRRRCDITLSKLATRKLQQRAAVAHFPYDGPTSFFNSNKLVKNRAEERCHHFGLV